MTTYADKAEALFLEGYNCAQAVLCAFAETCGLDRSKALRLASSLGGGIGVKDGVCGAALGMLMVLGLFRGFDTTDPTARQTHNARVKTAMAAFHAQFGHTSCEALREVGNRPLCATFVRFAAEYAAQARMDG